MFHMYSFLSSCKTYEKSPAVILIWQGETEAQEVKWCTAGECGNSTSTEAIWLSSPLIPQRFSLSAEDGNHKHFTLSFCTISQNSRHLNSFCSWEESLKSRCPAPILRMRTLWSVSVGTCPEFRSLVLRTVAFQLTTFLITYFHGCVTWAGTKVPSLSLMDAGRVSSSQTLMFLGHSQQALSEPLKGNKLSPC